MKSSKLNMTVLCVLACLVWFASPVVSGEAYRPARTDTPPKIDGVLNEDCWGSTAQVVRFVKIPGSDLDKKLYADSLARICYDSDFLYISIECFEPTVAALKKMFVERDDPVYTDDCVEVFISPVYSETKRYYHFGVNPVGTQFDQVARGAQGFDTGWNGKWTVGVKILKDRWVAEMRIPFSDLGVKNIDDVNLMGAAVCRERKSNKYENSAWRVGGRFHGTDGQLLFTTYEKYATNELMPIWHKQRNEITEMLKDSASMKKVHSQTLSDILKRTENAIAQLRKNLNGPNVSAIDKRIKSAAAETNALKRSVKFSLFMTKLRARTGGNCGGCRR